MEKLKRSEAIIALGKRLVEELGSEPDRTAIWMAHLIAERMDAVEQSTGEERLAAQGACAEAIYQLWSHRFSSPPGVNLLADAVPIAAALISLDPNRKSFRVFHEANRLAELELEKAPNDWLKFANELDRASKELIRYALKRGAEGGMTSPAFKAALAQAIDAEADVHIEIALFRNLLNAAELDEDVRVQAVANRARWERAERLEQFSKLAGELAAQLKVGLDEEPAKLSMDSILGL